MPCSLTLTGSDWACDTFEQRIIVSLFLDSPITCVFKAIGGGNWAKVIQRKYKILHWSLLPVVLHNSHVAPCHYLFLLYFAHYDFIFHDTVFGECFKLNSPWLYMKFKKWESCLCFNLLLNLWLWWVFFLKMCICTTSLWMNLMNIKFYAVLFCHQQRLRVNIDGCSSTPRQTRADYRMSAGFLSIVIGWFVFLVTGGLFGFTGDRFERECGRKVCEIDFKCSF